jgi:hypothetical protein
MGLILISLVFSAHIVFQQQNAVNGQEIKSQQAKDRVPDDLTDNMILPSFVYECLEKNKEISKEIDIPSVPLHNPYFVRGDFDGDRAIDYAVIVESREKNREGLLICFRKTNRAILLGLDPKNPPPFWLLMNWDVETPNELSKIRDFRGNAVGIKLRGESIVMKGEDWLGIIYWNGKQFRWKKVVVNEGN